MRFNPRPVFKPGVTFRVVARRAGGACFNPRPVFKPGVTTIEATFAQSVCVSIRARFLSRALPQALTAATPGVLFQSAPGF